MATHFEFSHEDRVKIMTVLRAFVDNEKSDTVVMNKPTVAIVLAALQEASIAASQTEIDLIKSGHARIDIEAIKKEVGDQLIAAGWQPPGEGTEPPPQR